MLPLLKKSTQQQFITSQIKLYNPPKELSEFELENQRKSSMVSSSRVNPKIRVMAGGFRKDDDTSKNGMGLYSSLQEPQTKLSMQQSAAVQLTKINQNSNLSAQIKLIEKKIRYHKKKLEQQKKKKQEMQKIKKDPFKNQFQKIIKHEIEFQGYDQKQPKGFDYLTNPGKLNQDAEPQEKNQPEPVLIQLPKKFEISEKIQKLEKHYQNSLKKKFERREMFPHYPCKRKTPKLYVTAKTNGLQKFGKKPPQVEHIFRVMTKQCTPQQIYPTIPNFAIVKDSLSKNVMAYLSDFKPFIDKTKEENKEEANQGDIAGKSQEGKTDEKFNFQNQV